MQDIIINWCKAALRLPDVYYKCEHKYIIPKNNANHCYNDSPEKAQNALKYLKH